MICQLVNFQLRDATRAGMDQLIMARPNPLRRGKSRPFCFSTAGRGALQNARIHSAYVSADVE
jgi:hypothetical protein